MPARVPDQIKSVVKREWLEGKPRNEIAAENSISSGAVTNIIAEYRRGLGLDLSSELRDLAVAMKKHGITVGQCALGLRIASTLQNMGVSEDRLEAYILDLYNRCIRVGLAPERISSHIEDLLEFSNAVVPLPRIPRYIEEKATERKALEAEIEKLKIRRELLITEQEKAKSLRNEALEQYETTITDLRLYSEMRTELAKYAIPVNDLSKFAMTVRNIKELGYEARSVIEDFSDLELLRSNRDTLRQILQSFEKKIAELGRQHSSLQTFVDMHKQTLTKYLHLESMGFGLKKLEFLRITINEIALENNIPAGEAVNRFLLDVEQHYSNKLGFEAKVESLREEVNKLNQMQARLRSELITLPMVGPKLVKLTQSGVNEQEIIKIAAIFEKYMVGSNSQSFLADLDKYGGLKLAIQKMTNDSDKLKSELVSLQSQTQDLNSNNQRVLISISNSRNTFNYLLGCITTLRNEILGLITIAACMTYSMKIQFESPRNMNTKDIIDGSNQFQSLTKACNGEDILMPELKKEVIKAIDILQGMIDRNDRLFEVLSDARAILSEKE